MAVTTGLGTGGTVINGNRGNSNNLMVDGGFNLDSGSNGSMINNVSLDFIDQVAIQTSNFAADKGRNSGASVNVVTKSGTNRLRGSVNETFRDESLDSANFFSPRDANGDPIKAKLEFQQLRRVARRSDHPQPPVLLHRRGVPNTRSSGISRAAHRADARRAAGRFFRDGRPSFGIR